jgi:hypothetical protein
MEENGEIRVKRNRIERRKHKFRKRNNFLKKIKQDIKEKRMNVYFDTNILNNFNLFKKESECLLLSIGEKMYRISLLDLKELKIKIDDIINLIELMEENGNLSSAYKKHSMELELKINKLKKELADKAKHGLTINNDFNKEGGLSIKE